jgi:hypothetical protein
MPTSPESAPELPSIETEMYPLPKFLPKTNYIVSFKKATKISVGVAIVATSTVDQRNL